MKITSISYGLTKNLGNFQSQRVDCTVELSDSLESPDTALQLATAFVNEALDLPLSQEDEELLAHMRSQVQA